MRTIDVLLANNARFVEDFPAGHLDVSPSRPDVRVFGDLDGQPVAAAGECLEEIRRAERCRATSASSTALKAATERVQKGKLREDGIMPTPSTVRR